jgi:hypothetical protein
MRRTRAQQVIFAKLVGLMQPSARKSGSNENRSGKKLPCLQGIYQGKSMICGSHGPYGNRNPLNFREICLQVLHFLSIRAGNFRENGGCPGGGPI